MIEYDIHRAGPADWKRVRAVRLRSLADAPDAFATTLAEDEARPDAEWQAARFRRSVLTAPLPLDYKAAHPGIVCRGDAAWSAGAGWPF